MRACMKRASELGMRIFRNNVGTGLVIRAKNVQMREAIINACAATAAKMGGSAARIRFGLCEGSGDDIGWTPYEIKPEDVGKTIAVFTSAEIKKPKGRSSDEQKQWAKVVNAAGGIAVVWRSADDVAKIAPSFGKVE